MPVTIDGTTGITTPGDTVNGTLTVNGALTTTGNDVNINNTSSTNLYVNQTANGVTLRLKADSTNVGVGPSGTVPLLFLMSNAETARFNTSGSLGIGTTAPTSLLSVAGKINNQYATMAIPLVPITSIPTGKTRVAFIPTGADQTWAVPAGITSIFVKMWGAGGGGGNSGGWVHGSRGGGGGHALGIIPVTAGETLYIVVGVAGQTNYAGGQTARYGGGGGMYNNSDNRYCGSGGGYTGIFRTSISQANALMIAGGGGGGGASRYEDCCWGGAGGGTTGQLGGFTDGRNTSGGGPGTQSGGGAAGLTQNTVGTAGSALLGGYGASNAYGGGGGGGYYGGGGGGYYESNNMCGGGGGSGFLGATVQFGSLHTGCRETPAMYNDNDLPKTLETYNSWAPYAVGGDRITVASQTTNVGGGGGYMVIYY
jgi:hypothetical protein